MALDAVLVKAGFPPMSEWWKSVLEEFYLAEAVDLILRVGRRGGKSTTLCRVGVAEALYGRHVIPPGDVGVIPVVSVDKRESAGRIYTIRTILKAIGVTPTKSQTDNILIDVNGSDFLFRTFTATIAGVSGFTGVCPLLDEVAKWKDNETGANPAAEVISSIKPTIATQPLARVYWSSSPWSTLDSHYLAFERGNVDKQRVAYAPSWLANPTLTEDSTHVLEKDESKWRREYKAIPQAAISNAFAPEMIDRAFRSTVPAQYGQPILVIDPSSGGGDAFTYAIVEWGWPTSTVNPWVTEWIHGVEYFKHDDEGKRIPSRDYEAVRRQLLPFIRFRNFNAFTGRFKGKIKADEIVEHLARLCSDNGITDVHSDQREAMALESLFENAGLTFTSHTWSAPSKAVAVAALKRWLAEAALLMEPCSEMRKELGTFSEHITPSGMITYGARGKAHDDYVALLLTAAMADNDGLIPSSPMFKGGMGKSTASMDERSATVL
jgi:hypothetical protein